MKEEIETLYHYPRVLILDTDITPRSVMQQDSINQFIQGTSRILVSTQAILHKNNIPPVDVVGIISLDTMLYAPTYAASEQVYHLIDGLLSYCKPRGGCLLQTHTPDYAPLRMIAAQQYLTFINQEREIRKQLHYPPFSHAVKLIFSDLSASKAKEKAQKIKHYCISELEKRDKDSECIGPFAGYIPKVKNRYIYALLLKIKNISLEQRNSILRALSARVDSIDVDPESVL